VEEEVKSDEESEKCYVLNKLSSIEKSTGHIFWVVA